ncbi:primosomal protein N' (replication factor Y) [Moryella indoligenes]|uniref:Replication restart protein PriA n=2 Tax=Moryella indoligenes TaxID=371674 RepID=A0AAE4AKQ6_9FIRM|nr:primosomal protein N' [Moryella indoligenes]MDQ0152484.1 primosomal protein N' (replication factor Y) [Moryella indoligenes]
MNRVYAYADVMIGITHESVDRPFTYAVPEALRAVLVPGMPVRVPFGRGKELRTGYVLALRESPPEGISRIREIAAAAERTVSAEQDLVEMALWMHRHYGCMLNQALKTVLPVKRKVKARSGKELFPGQAGTGKPYTLTEEQSAALHRFSEDRAAGRSGRYLLFGITGSGKTELYIAMLREVLSEGRQGILLLPEIALSFQIVRRLRAVFGDRVAILHSRLSAGERYEQFRRAAEGEADIMVGPRSAVFAPLRRLGLIIMDEEHDSAYKNDTVPRYETRDVAEKRAELADCPLVLGSATPSVQSWAKAQSGRYTLLRLSRRAVPGAQPAAVRVVDLRQELREGNRSVFSLCLQELIRDRLSRREQTILFMNRRGYSNFVSCRSCGNAIRCPHCDVTLTLHEGERLVCHYCGYTIALPGRCPDCGSPYLAGFGTGTQKLEGITKKLFPAARVLRMDADAASGKHAGRDILSAFAAGEADILIGTQMVVKGHDFPNVTLVGIMAADTELYLSSYDSAERSFQLLVQAAGRAGRGARPGAVVIQTYRPDHYAVRTAAAQDYESFVQEELAYREAGGYPPLCSILTVQLASKDELLLRRAAELFTAICRREAAERRAVFIGPVNASVYKVHDYFRKLIYMKHSSYDILLDIKNAAEPAFRAAFPGGISLLYDFS